MKTRIAPTPSGLLHAGNAWSFLLTWLMARGQGGGIRLRVDDLDTARFREEYIEDIFLSLRWLGMDWDTGPRTVAEVKGVYSQRLRIPRYRAALERLMGLTTEAGPLLYACSCSREKVRRDALATGRPGVYPGTCRSAGIDWREAFDDPHPSREAYPLRVRVPGNAEVTLAEAAGPMTGTPPGKTVLFPGRDMGDFVVWQRNGEPAYQLASLVDDEEYGMDLIVRGRDLLPSTGAQLWLAGKLGYGVFPKARFLHHDLLLDPEGGKLSKSEGAISLRGMRERLDGPQAMLAFFARRLGIRADRPRTAADLLPGFVPERIPAGPLLWSDLAREAGLA